MVPAVIHAAHHSLDIHAMALLDAAANPLAWEADTPGPYAGAVRRGFMRTAAGIMAYASCPVLRNYEEGPVRGSLIEGKRSFPMPRWPQPSFPFKMR